MEHELGVSTVDVWTLLGDGKKLLVWIKLHTSWWLHTDENNISQRWVP